MATAPPGLQPPPPLRPERMPPMDAVHFDALARVLTRTGSRRSAALRFSGLALGGALAVFGLDRTKAKHKKKKKKKKRAAVTPVSPPPCVPNCDGKSCGPNGCGGSCGPCIGGTCSSGQCICAADTYDCAG